MNASQNAISLIKSCEGLRIAPYDDGAGYMTIGWGHRILPGENFTTIDKVTANQLLMKDISIAESSVNNCLTVPVNQNQYDALVDFTFNLGVSNLESSTLLNLLNKGSYQGAANEFSKWVYAGNPPKVMPGLVSRRNKEQQLFLKPVIT